MKRFMLSLAVMAALSGCCTHQSYKTYLTWHRPQDWDIESRCLNCDRLVGYQEITHKEYTESLVVKEINGNPYCHLVRGNNVR